MTVTETDARLSTHEAVCAERYTNIMLRLGRLEKIIIAVVGMSLMGLIATLGSIVLRSIHLT